MTDTEPPYRRNDRVQGAYVLAILYTVGYLSMLGALMVVEIPTGNRELLLTLVGIMSAAQLGIIKFYYDGTQGQQVAQVANIARAARSEATIQEIAKAVPSVLAPIKAEDVAVQAAGDVTVTGKP